MGPIVILSVFSPSQTNSDELGQLPRDREVGGVERSARAGPLRRAGQSHAPLGEVRPR